MSSKTGYGMQKNHALDSKALYFKDIDCKALDSKAIDSKTFFHSEAIGSKFYILRLGFQSFRF